MLRHQKANRIDLFTVRTPWMRAFHMSWIAFFLCFFAWFGIAPFMPIIREELRLTQEQIANTIVASVAITILARLLIGWLCDRIGPRRAYAGLLLVGSLPVMGIGLAHDYHSFLLFRLAIGAIGASFVITQYHTSVMFAPNCVGTANAVTAGWGNLGGGVTQIVMPLLLAALVGLGMSPLGGWRACMLIAGVLCFLVGIGYYFLTQDYPHGNHEDVRRPADRESARGRRAAFWLVLKDYRVWMLFLMYGACFGVELTINNIAVLYFTDYFKLGLAQAGLVAGLFGLTNIFARALGGYLGDQVGLRWGLRGRSRWLMVVLLAEAFLLIAFSSAQQLILAIVLFLLFGVCVAMACGATYAVVPFISRQHLGLVSGIVGAGGNVGALLAGLLFKHGLLWPRMLLLLGFAVLLSAACGLLVRFSRADEHVSAVEQTSGELEQTLARTTLASAEPAEATSHWR